MYDRAITAGAIDLNADRVGPNRQTGDADDLHATAGLDGVIAHRITCIRRLEQRQAELEVGQHQPHSTIRCRGVAAVYDPVAVAVDPVRSADTDEAVNIRSTYLEHGYLLGWVIRIVTWCVIHEFDNRSAALLEGELTADVDELVDSQGYVATDLQEVLIKIDDDEVVSHIRPRAHLESGGAAESTGIQRRTGLEVHDRHWRAVGNGRVLGAVD